MSKVVTKAPGGEQDLNRWDGVTPTFTRLTSTGSTITLRKVGYEVDAVQSYGGGVNFNSATITSALTAIGTSNKVTLVLAPGTWTIATALTIPANITLKVPGGAILTKSGSGTMAINGPFEAGQYKVFFDFSAGNITFGQKQPYYLCEWWGGTGDGATDNLVPIQCQHDSIPAAGGKMLFPGNDYRISGAIDITKPVEITSASTTNAAAIVTTSATANIFVIACDNGVYIHDISLDYTTTRSAGSAIRVSGATAGTINTYSRFSRLRFGVTNPGYVHINFMASGYWTVRENMFHGATYAIYIQNIVDADAGDNTIEGNTFTYGTTSGCYAIHQDSCSGLRIINNKVIGFEFAYDMNLQETSGVLVIVGNSFEGSGTSAIRLAQGVAGAITNSVIITGNEIAGAANFVRMDAGTTAWIKYFAITGNTYFFMEAAGTAILLNGGEVGTITGNTLHGAIAGSPNGTGINIGSQTVNANVANNTLAGFTTPIICASTTSVINHTLSGGMTFAQLPAQAANGSLIYVSDGTIASPVAGSGPGCLAKRLAGAWVGN
ncbi:MAG: hypothetical protein ABIJ57_12610 [Pseudomonadota bacterium]